MINNSLIEKIKHPELLDDRSLKELEIVLEEYPYFQTAHLLYIKNLLNQGSITFDRELKKTSVWVTDRRKLFYLLDERVLLPVDEEQKLEIKETLTSDIIDFSSLSIATALAEEYIEEEQSEKESMDELDSIILSGSATMGTFFDVGDKVDLEDFKNTFKNPNKKLNQPEKVEATSKNDFLIDNFIREKPRIVPKEMSEQEVKDISEYSIQENTELMTDTLAKIYIKQGLNEKAILTYEKLSLKYPEKKVYFAGQIEKIKQIINNK